MWRSIARGTALAYGAFFGLSCAGGVSDSRLDLSIWLVDIRWLSPAACIVAEALAAAALVSAGIGATRSNSTIRYCTLMVLGALLIHAVGDAAGFWVLLARGEIRSEMPVPASLLWTAVYGVAVLAILSDRTPRTAAESTRTRRVATVVSSVVALAGLPMVQMVCFGLTDYRSKADAVLVFGARAYADGRASDALEDRMLAACELVREGRATRLIVSGGPGDGTFHEADVMRRIALDAGISESDVIIDRDGVNTHASVLNAAKIARERGFSHILAVSHFYHLPRIKMEATHAGLDVRTVPASQRGRVLRALPYFMAREAAAWWRGSVKGLL